MADQQASGRALGQKFFVDPIHDLARSLEQRHHGRALSLFALSLPAPGLAPLVPRAPESDWLGRGMRPMAKIWREFFGSGFWMRKIIFGAGIHNH
jgi:hypothetical protein